MCHSLSIMFRDSEFHSMASCIAVNSELDYYNYNIMHTLLSPHSYPEAYPTPSIPDPSPRWPLSQRPNQSQPISKTGPTQALQTIMFIWSRSIWVSTTILLKSIFMLCSACTIIKRIVGHLLAIILYYSCFDGIDPFSHNY